MINHITVDLQVQRNDEEALQVLLPLLLVESKTLHGLKTSIDAYQQWMWRVRRGVSPLLFSFFYTHDTDTFDPTQLILLHPFRPYLRKT